MKTNIRLGYGHMDMGNSAYKEYVKGNLEISEFDPDRPRTGSHYCIVDVLGGDRIPIDPDYDYSDIESDLIYLWLQGGAYANSKPLKALKKLRLQWDGILLINWEETYWFDDAYVRSIFEKQLESAKYTDAVVCGFIDFDKRMEKAGVPLDRLRWRYLVTPYDVDWLRYNYSHTPKSEPKRIYSMIHGRITTIDKTLLIMHALRRFPLEFILNRYRFVTEDGFEKVNRRRLGVKSSDMDFIKIISPIEPWDAYIKYLASSYIFIDEYPAYSQSHATIDAACAGTPTVSHIHNSSAVNCFPSLCVKNFNNIQEWIDITKKLLDDESFYNQTRDYGLVAVSHYGFNSFLSQLYDLYDELKR